MGPVLPFHVVFGFPLAVRVLQAVPLGQIFVMTRHLRIFFLSFFVFFFWPDV